MKNYWKISTIALATALVVSVGSDFLSGQTSTTVAPSGAATPARGPRAGAAATLAGESEEPLPGKSRRQPHMDTAWRLLGRAAAELETAAHDKGGFREKAIDSIEKARIDVRDGILYADDHPEEFPDRGARGARGAAPRAGAARGATSGNTTTTTVPTT